MFEMQSRLAHSMHENTDGSENDVMRSSTEVAIPHKFGANAASIRPLVKAMTLASKSKRKTFK